MFTNVGWGEILVLAVVALVVLGPERLPEAARWLAGAVRKVKEFAGTAQQQLTDDFGTDLDQFREPLSQLNELRGMTPRALVTKHLLDGDESLFHNPFDQAAPAADAAQHGAAGQPAQAAQAGQPARPVSKSDIYKQSAAERSGSTAVAGGGESAPVPVQPTVTPPAATGPVNWDDAT